jgi:SAM-dependent methyltransferase
MDAPVRQIWTPLGLIVRESLKVNPIVKLLRPIRRWLIRQTRIPRVGAVNFGDLARLEPVSRDWGFDRGTPIDRYYIENFLKRHSGDIRGRVLEVADNEYTLKFGGNNVAESHVLHPVAGNPRATVVGDLGTGNGLPDACFDCIICTQTLQFVYPLHRAVESLFRMLKKRGVLLVTVPGISQISREDMANTGDYWRFTTASLEKLLIENFGDEVTVECAGNVYAATAFLQGIATEESDLASLQTTDPQYQMMLLGRAVRQG